MDKKSKIILVLLVITLLSLSSYASLSRFSKGINKEGSINTTELSYCALNEIETLSECLIRNDSKQELSLALNTIDDRTNRVDFSKIEPYDIYIPKTDYINISDKTNTEGIISTTETNFTYVVESKLINPFDVNEETDNITFNEETGYYTYTNSLVGSINDIITTSSDIDNNIYKYTCLNSENNGNCEELYLFTEEAYLISNEYIFKEGYKYSNELTDTTSMNAGLYKGEDDYTTNDSNYTYYYRGDVKNNWVEFGNYLWRIVRINGDGTIRMIYSGLVDANSHTGKNAQISTSSFGFNSALTIKTPDITGLANDLIAIKYYNNRYSHTNAGYMYNPEREIATYPNKELSSVNNLSTFPKFHNTAETTYHYFFKNFNPQEDCVTSDGNGDYDNATCILKCRKLGNDGEDDADCVYSTWNDMATKEENYSTTAPGVYPETNPTQYVYQKSDTDGGYRYVCWRYFGNTLIRENSDGTTSVYTTCPVVSEIVGTMKNQPTSVRVRYHGLFSKNLQSSNANVLDSSIKNRIDTWYQDSIYNHKDANNNYLEDYLADSIFCNDRSSQDTFPFVNSYSYHYNSYYRTRLEEKNPSFKCLNTDGTFNKNDAFTLKTSENTSIVESSGIGNSMLTYPVGLITLDEAFYAGGIYNIINDKYYLYTGEDYWTMTPGVYSTEHIHVFVGNVAASGRLYNYDVSAAYGVRPVINLKSDILYKSGNGTEFNPYIIDVNN